ncbi:RodZ family helix-turn-helix domain-containing protein [Pseudomonas sp. RP23018S]|uniref:RodZ family helix-turn-helix domain-containing protein n=1 Tax=Pseudomonas sp. RP23018S TaxID=3096037 RepID=UPI002ACA3778|nr:RodZ family helix-turn-helix domain-containing protein [Pseudomonas sp. RP23018S]MDZ5603342.1 RodZ family helix-turn-helix domain-containing protein [Pseudomonas sp. RP23018S]
MNAAYPESASATHQNPGETLRQAREHRGWSQTEVARRLNLTITSLNNLETGAFDKLPGHTFARGYIRAYAKLMDLDQAPLVAAFDQVTGSNAKGSDVHSLGRIEEPRRLSQNILRGVSLLVLVAVVGGGFVWWQDQGSLRGKDLTKMALEHVEVESADGTTQIHPLDEPEDQAVSAAQQPESTALALQSPAEQGATEEAAPAASTHQPSATAPVTAPAATVPGAAASGAVAPATPASAAASSTAPVREETAAAPAGTGKVAITFVADCWAQVTDGNGKVLTSSVKRKGDTLELSGKPPFAVRLGFARGAQVSYNGQAVNLAPFTSGETARLKLGQ